MTRPVNNRKEQTPISPTNLEKIQPYIDYIPQILIECLVIPEKMVNCLANFYTIAYGKDTVNGTTEESDRAEIENKRTVTN